MKVTGFQLGGSGAYTNVAFVFDGGKRLHLSIDAGGPGHSILGLNSIALETASSRAEYTFSYERGARPTFTSNSNELTQETIGACLTAAVKYIRAAARTDKVWQALKLLDGVGFQLIKLPGVTIM